MSARQDGLPSFCGHHTRFHVSLTRTSRDLRDTERGTRRLERFVARCLFSIPFSPSLRYSFLSFSIKNYQTGRLYQIAI